MLGSGGIPHIRIFELRLTAMILLHELIVAGRLILVILHVARVLEVILDFLWNVVVLERFKSTKARVIGLRCLFLTTTELLGDVIQILYGVSEIVVRPTHSTKPWLLLLAPFLTSPSSGHLLLPLAPLISRKWPVFPATSTCKASSFLAWNLIQVLIYNCRWVLLQIREQILITVLKN